MSHVSDPNSTSVSSTITAAHALGLTPSASASKIIDDKHTMTKAKLFAHSLYVDDIDFVQDQKNFMSESAAREYSNSNAVELDYDLQTPIPGYTVTQCLSPTGSNTYYLKGLRDATREPVIIRVSLDFTYADHIARFFNDWYITLGLNPAHKSRPWVINSKLPPPSDIFASARVPVTLPPDLPAVLYPLQAINIVNEVNGIKKKLMGLIYTDHEYSTLYDHYSKKTSDLTTDKTSLASSSLFSQPSDLSGTDVSLDKTSNFLSRENADYTELANRVKQLPKPAALILDIMRDIMAVAEILRDCHNVGVVHNGLSTHNILRTPDNYSSPESRSKVVITNWDFSFTVAMEDSSSLFRNKNFDTIQSMLHYMSPESSGGTSTNVDYRSDFYSVGVILYELIVGCLPFRSDNLVSLRRMLFNQKPIQPKVLGPKWISDDLNYVILKCLEKNPCDRYSNAEHLINDIESVMKSYSKPLFSEKGQVQFTSYITPEADSLPLYHTSVSKINNNRQIAEVYACVKSPEPSKIIVITGEAGVGKATVPEQMSAQPHNKKEFVIHWKYHYSDRNVFKYASAMYGVYVTTKQILGSSEEIINEWRQLITDEIDVDLTFLFHSIPNLQTLLGPQYQTYRKQRTDHASAEPLSAAENISSFRNIIGNELDVEVDITNNAPPEPGLQELNTELKYIFVFKRLLSLLARKGLTLIMDNMNLCPSDEFAFITEALEYCQNESRKAKVTLIASCGIGYVDNENTGRDRLKLMSETLNWPFHLFQLKSLPLTEFQAFSGLYGQELNSPTLGKSFYSLSEGNLLAFNYLIRISKLSSHGASSVRDSLQNTADELSANHAHKFFIKEYLATSTTQESLEVLKFASLICVSGVFNLSDLMVVTGLPLVKLFGLVQICLQSRLVVPTGVCYKVPFHLIVSNDFVFDIEDSLVWDFATRTRFRFDHDVVKYELINMMKKDNELEELHRLCGLRLKKKLSKEFNSKVSAYLNMASHLYNSQAKARPEDYKHYVDAMIVAGRYAIATSNLDLALRYFTAATNFIPKNDKRKRLKVMLSRVQCNYFLKDYQESIRIIQQAEHDFLENNLTLLHLKVCSLFNLKHYKEGMEIAIQTLKSLKVEISSDEKECQQIAEKHFSQLPLSTNEIRNLKFLKKATNKQFILISGLILDMTTPTYVLDLPHVRKAILSQLIKLMHAYGYTTSCAIPLLHFANYFVQISPIMSTIKAEALADAALSLVNTAHGASTSLTQSINECYTVIMALFRQPVLKILKSTILIEEEHINDQFVRSWLMAAQLIMGCMRGWTNSTQSLKRVVALDGETERQVFSNLAALWRDDSLLYDLYEQWKGGNTVLSPDLQYVSMANMVINAYAQQRPDLACDIVMNGGMDILKKVPMLVLHIWFYFAAVICLLTYEEEHLKAERMQLAEEIAQCFRTWSTTCYANFGSDLKLMQAIILSYKANASPLTILDLYEEAIEDAERQQKWLGVALGNRMCAIWLKRCFPNSKRCTSFAQRAFALYSTMSTSNQAECVKRDFPEVSDSFNWAGVRNVMPALKPKLENANFFDERRIPDINDLSVKESSNSSRFSIAMDTGIPKLKELKSLEKSSTNEPTHDEWTEAIKLCLTISQSSSQDLIVQTLLESTLMFSGVDYGAVILNTATQEPAIKAIGTVNNIYLFDDELLTSRVDLVPYSLVIQCLLTGLITCKGHDTDKNSDFIEDLYFISNAHSTGLCIPIKTSTVMGVLYLESHLHNGLPKLQFPLIDTTKIDLLYLLCSQAAVSFSKSAVYTQMELAKKAAEEATDEKASFLANMSHEIRTPFNSLFACSLFLLDTPLNPIQKEYVETIKESALVTLNIIDGILAFTKIEQGSFTLDSEPFDINDTIEGAILLSLEQVNSELFEFAYFNKCPQIVSVTGDATRVRQIIINLVGNALKFTSKGFVKVILEAKALNELRYELQLIVEDTGFGIPDKSKSKVFGAFSQADGSSRRVYGGSGLGLAISSKLAEMMNGKISFTSTEGQGSTFIFSCPFEVEVEKIDKVLPCRNVAIVSHTNYRKQALKETFEYLGSRAILFDDVQSLFESDAAFDIIMIDKAALTKDVKIRSSLRKPCPQIYALTRFGVVLSEADLLKIEVDQMLFSPLRSSLVEKLIRLDDEENSKLKSDKFNPGGTEGVAELTSSHDDASSSSSEPIPLNILLAEDNPVNLRVALQHLKKLGYIADHAKDGVEVLEKCEAKLKEGLKYDVIFMDIQMPRKDGIEATIELNESFNARGLQNYIPQIVALTANVASEERARCIQCGMVDFVTKPILPEMLKRVLNEVGRRISTPGFR